jgi:hypothetical protein
MKKVIKSICLLLVVALCFSFVGCSTLGKVEKALNEIGYVKTTQAGEYEEETEYPVTVHAFSNKDGLGLTEIAKLNTVIVLEFKATDDMKAYCEESDTLKGIVSDISKDGNAQDFYNALVEKGLANGNCLVFSINPLQAETVMNAIKNA